MRSEAKKPALDNEEEPLNILRICMPVFMCLRDIYKRLELLSR